MVYKKTKDTKGVCGKGYKDKNTPVAIDGKIDPAYACWSNMINRCYSGRYKGYNAEVCSEWLMYENFRDWFYTQDWKGKELDKDILGDGSIYSPETCMFISKQLNNFLVRSNRSLGKPFGTRVMTKEGWLYKVYVRNPFNGKREYYGSYKNIKDAQEKYDVVKNQHFQEMLRREVST